MSDDLRHVYVYGRLPGLSRAQIASYLVKIGGTLIRGPARATAIVLAHAAARECLRRDPVLTLPFEPPPAAHLVSEGAFRKRLGVASAALAFPAGPHTASDVARLSGLSVETCRALALFDLLAPIEGMHGYQDVAAARQVARLLGEGVPLHAVVAAGWALGARGLRVSQVRLAAAPWGEVVQQVGTTIARLDGQFALVLDEAVESAEASFASAQGSEAEGDLAGAERWYGRAERLDRNDPIIPFNLGNVLAAQGRRAEATLAFNRALARDPLFAEAGFNLAQLSEREGRNDEALRVYRATIAAHPAYAQALFNAARLLTTLHRFAEALPLWDRFIGLAPDDPDTGYARRMATLCRLEGRVNS